jgi:hypothetical protein
MPAKAPKHQAPKHQTPKRSLVDFVMAKKRAGCLVCGLPAAVRTELASARTKKIKRSEQLEWLTAEYGLKLRPADFDAHYSGRHEQ